MSAEKEGKQGEILLFLSEAEKEKSIDLILTRGLPQKRFFVQEIYQTYRQLGLGNLMYNAWGCMLAAVLFMGIFDFLFDRAQSAVGIETPPVLLQIFLMTPVFYGLQYLLSLWKEILFGTYEMKAVCRISFRQLQALRSMLFGIVSLLLALLSDLILYYCLREAQHPVSFIRLLEVSFTGVFLYAGLQAAVQRTIRMPYNSLIPAVLWALISIGGLAIESVAEDFLWMVPDLCYGILCLAMLIVIAVGIKREYCLPGEQAAAYFN